jgi:hypothetical protein
VIALFDAPLPRVYYAIHACQTMLEVDHPSQRGDDVFLRIICRRVTHVTLHLLSTCSLVKIWRRKERNTIMILCFREQSVSVFVCLLQKHEAMRWAPMEVGAHWCMEESRNSYWIVHWKLNSREKDCVLFPEKFLGKIRNCCLFVSQWTISRHARIYSVYVRKEVHETCTGCPSCTSRWSIVSCGMILIHKSAHANFTVNYQLGVISI